LRSRTPARDVVFDDERGHHCSRPTGRNLDAARVVTCPTASKGQDGRAEDEPAERSASGAIYSIRAGSSMTSLASKITLTEQLSTGHGPTRGFKAGRPRTSILPRNVSGSGAGIVNSI